MPVDQKLIDADAAIEIVTGSPGPNCFELTSALPALATVKMAADVSTAKTDPAVAEAALDRWLNTLSSMSYVSKREAAKAKQALASVMNPRHQLKMGHYRNSPLKEIEGIDPESGVPLGGFEHIQNAIWTWVRGFHASLYDNCLTMSSPHVVQAPLPLFTGTVEPRPLVDAEYLNRRRYQAIQPQKPDYLKSSSTPHAL